jgi:hypothetical protein
MRIDKVRESLTLSNEVHRSIDTHPIASSTFSIFAVKQKIVLNM